ncbi:MAG: isochorismate synthase [Chloroflexi bacterium]|nr:isochorismate synthase [Chloroflexota bacterium]
MNHIINYTIPTKPYSLTEFLRFGSGMERFYFESDQSQVAIAGLGIAAQISKDGADRFTELGRSIQEFFQHITCINRSDLLPRPILLGGGSFFGAMESGIWDSFPQASLILPRYALIRVGGETFFSVNQLSAQKDALRSEAESFLAKFESAIPSTPSMPDELVTQETSRADWQSAIERSVKMIQQGELKKIVLARLMQVTGNRAIDVPPMLGHLGGSCPACFRFLFEFSPSTIFAGATPERLVSVSGAKFITAAIAGSMPRGDHPAEDEALGQQLLNSAKDQSEHIFVVEQIREKMSPLTESLNIASTPKLLRLPNIQHLRTNISGTLKADHSILNIVAALHPTPAVGGTPTETALRVMRGLEGFERGWYAAPVGWVDSNGNGDFVVAIRSGLFRDNTATLFGGAGIVASSDPQKEWDETGLKIRFLLNAMQGEMA